MVDFLYDRVVQSPCCPRNSQGSSPVPHFKSINSLAFSLLYGPTLTSVSDYWKNYSIDCTDLALPTKVHIVKAMVFLVVMYGCESWTIKKAEH